MRSIFRLAVAAVAGTVVLTLTGCVVAPAYPAYGGGYGAGYGGGYYAPAPVVVSPSVGFYGRWGGGGGGRGRYWR